MMNDSCIKCYLSLVAGSKFWHPGMFEVKKTEDIPEEERDESGCPLTVRVSSDLEGCSRVKVRIIDSTEEDVDMDISNTDQHDNGKCFTQGRIQARS